MSVVVEPQSAATKATAGNAGAKCENIERMVLPNGLTLIVGENAKLPLVSIRAQFLAGVPAETEANAGVTQVTAQMLMKGTRKRSAEELAGTLESRGGGLMAQGDVHRLILGADVMRGDEALGMDLIADLALNAQLSCRGSTATHSKTADRSHPGGAGGSAYGGPAPLPEKGVRRCALCPHGARKRAEREKTHGRRLPLAALTARAHNGADGVVSVFGDVRAKAVRRAGRESLCPAAEKGERDTSGATAFGSEA